MLLIGLLAICGCAGEKESMPDTEAEITSYTTGDTETEITSGTIEDANSENTLPELRETEMKLYINDVNIPVNWEENASVAEIRKDALVADIVISMSKYGGFEQVGAFGKKYSSNDEQTTTQNGDIVLYNASNVVMFYGSNTWQYTRLGRMNLSESEVIALLSGEDITIKISVK